MTTYDDEYNTNHCRRRRRRLLSIFTQLFLVKVKVNYEFRLCRALSMKARHILWNLMRCCRSTSVYPHQTHTQNIFVSREYDFLPFLNRKRFSLKQSKTQPFNLQTHRTKPINYKNLP